MQWTIASEETEDTLFLWTDLQTLFYIFSPSYFALAHKNIA